MIGILIFGAVLLIANAQDTQTPTISCDFGHDYCRHAYDQRVKILQMYERVWNQCPVVSALDRNIGYLERGWDVNRVMREHVRGDYWPVKYIYGKDSAGQIPPLYDVYLARNATRDEINSGSQTTAMFNDYKIVEDQIANSPESFSKYRFNNIVPGCGRDGIDCTWILDSITQSYCRLFNVCPDASAYLEQSLLLGTGDLGTPMMVHRHYMHSAMYESIYITGKSPSQRVASIYRHLLNRDVTPSEDISGALASSNLNYRQTVIDIQNSAEYQSKWGKWGIPGDDVNGQDIELKNLSFNPPCR